jgi:hypothetical protein
MCGIFTQNKGLAGLAPDWGTQKCTATLKQILISTLEEKSIIWITRDTLVWYVPFRKRKVFQYEH